MFMNPIYNNVSTHSFLISVLRNFIHLKVEKIYMKEHKKI